LCKKEKSLNEIYVALMKEIEMPNSGELPFDYNVIISYWLNIKKEKGDYR